MFHSPTLGSLPGEGGEDVKAVPLYDCMSGPDYNRCNKKNLVQFSPTQIQILYFLNV